MTDDARPPRTSDFELRTQGEKNKSGCLAQRAPKVWRIGFLAAASQQDFTDGRLDALIQGMRELGYVENKNLVIEARYGDGNYDRLPDLAVELVRLKVDVIVAVPSPA